jgi:hypothetical protein
MNEVAKLLHALTRKGIIRNYAIFGAVAQMRYTQAVVTLDLDVLVDLPEPNSLALLAPIYDYCRQQGYAPAGEAVAVGDWPVQFIPTFDDLSREALQAAEVADWDGSEVRVVRADYLAAMALKLGRAKDKIRILALIEADAVTPADLRQLATKHQLLDRWERFSREFLDAAR